MANVVIVWPSHGATNVNIAQIVLATSVQNVNTAQIVWEIFAQTAPPAKTAWVRCYARPAVSVVNAEENSNARTVRNAQTVSLFAKSAGSTAMNAWICARNATRALAALTCVNHAMNIATYAENFVETARTAKNV